MRWPEYWGSCRPCSWTRDDYKINKIIHILCTRGVSYALYKSLLISKFFCTNGCMGRGMGRGEGEPPPPPSPSGPCEFTSSRWGREEEGEGGSPPPITNTYTAAAKLMHVKLSTLLGPNCTRFACCHFRAPKSLDFQGPPLPNALEMDLPASKSLRPAPYKQQVQ
jgi:hypothetical protein